MADASLEWRGDLVLTPDGDIALAEGADETRQRIERRLFTAVRGYVWHQSYGAGLPERIGRPARARGIQALVRGQIALEATVAQNPPPQVTVTEASITPGLFAIDIRYTEAVSGAPVTLNLQVPGSA